MLVACVLVLGACASVAPRPIGSLDVDADALIWGDQSFAQSFSVLRGLPGSVEVNEAAARLSPFADVPTLPDMVLEWADVSLFCSFSSPCPDELYVAVRTRVSTSATVDEIAELLTESPNFPTLRTDMGVFGLERAMTTTAAGNRVDINAVEFGDRSEVEITHFVEGIQDDLNFDRAARVLAPSIAADSTLRNLQFDAQPEAPTITVSFATPAATEEQARQATIDALVTASWTQQGDMFVMQVDGEQLVATLRQSIFADGLLQTELRIEPS